MGEKVGPKWQEERIQEKKTKLSSAREEIKNGNSTKRHQIQQVQKKFWAVEKSLSKCVASNGK